jgi:solute carrier family 36 (proton-coupled amino acid transporter)
MDKSGLVERLRRHSSRGPHGQKGINTFALHTAIIFPMTSPTRPVNIVSPRLSSAAGVGTPSSRRGPGSRGSPAGTPYSGGTPDVRSLRAQYVGTPPLPNIPARTSTPRPSSSTEPLVFGRGSPRFAPTLSELSARRPATPAVGLGLEDAPPPDPTIDTESFQGDERVKVLRKHLVSREERQAANFNGSSGVPSRQASSSNLAFEFQPDPEAFPVPYHTPGADTTYVD